MLKNTFTHIPSIGQKAEENLWAAGVLDWDIFSESHKTKFSEKKMELIRKHLDESKDHFHKQNPKYFESSLKSSQHWRFFPEFRDASVYLDIETNGEDSTIGFITTIALYDGHSIFYYVKGQNLEDFIEDIKKYKVVITYSGKCFDIPFIENQFQIKMEHAHIDLRYVLANLGYKGGLKACEIALGIDRGELTGVDGSFAVLLWSEFIQNRNQKALETLLAYNIEDVMNLEKLMILAYNMNIKKTPFGNKNKLPTPQQPDIPFQPHMETIKKVQRLMYW